MINIQDIKKFKKKNESSDVWKVGNSILYDMCETHPYHNDESEIVAKVWLIGRSYAASIERHKRQKNISDDFYSDIIAPKFKIDDLLSEVRKLDKNKLDYKNIKIIIKTHKKVVDFIKENITKDDKRSFRSFASKYLHFHFRNLFFIYDTRTAGTIKGVLRDITINNDDAKKIKEREE